MFELLSIQYNIKATEVIVASTVVVYISFVLWVRKESWDRAMKHGTIMVWDRGRGVKLKTSC